MSGKSFIDHFSALEDPRQAWKVVYPLPEILRVVLCATLGGAEDFVEIARRGNRKLDFLRRLLPCARGVAWHDTLDDGMNAPPAPLFAACFTAWVESLREAAPDIVAIDGKTSRRRRARGAPAAPGLGLGEPPAAGAAAGGRRRDHGSGALVTIDALPDRDRRAIRGKGADYSSRSRTTGRRWPSRRPATPPSGRSPPRDHRRRPRPHRGPPRRRQPRRGLDRLGSTLPRRVALPRPRSGRHGRGRGRARRQDQPLPPPPHLLRPSLRARLRRRRPRPLGHREPR